MRYFGCFNSQIANKLLKFLMIVNINLFITKSINVSASVCILKLNHESHKENNRKSNDFSIIIACRILNGIFHYFSVLMFNVFETLR